MSILYQEDKIRYQSSCVKSHALRFLWILRHRQSGDNIIFKLIQRRMLLKYGLEISPKTTIGGGLYLGHAFNITINPNAKIGRNCNIHKGVTIGQENRGTRKGAPTIGDEVWIGVNSTVVGLIEIGDNVLIAPNTYVNCDVPSHSIVLGNPCKIIPRDNATAEYIMRKA